MRVRISLLLAVSACEASAPPPEPPPPAWVYAPPPPVWPLGEVRGRIGRTAAPVPAERAGIAGDVRFPLRQPTPWAVPDATPTDDEHGKAAPARAVIYGLEGATPAIEVIDVDAGRVLWRDTKVCAGPVVGVTADAIVCADAGGVRGVALDGKHTWRSPAQYVAMSDEHVVVAPLGEAMILDAATGDELSRVKLPASVNPETVIASCGDAGRELFAAGPDGNLVRIADTKGGTAIAWSTPIGTVDEIDACTGDSVVVRVQDSWIAVARATGAITGRVDGVRGAWRARDGSGRLEISTYGGVAVWPRDLSAQAASTELPPLGALLASRGELRLVRATPSTAVLLDRTGVRAYLPLAAMGAVLGDRALVAGSWSGSAGEQLRRFALPPRAPGAALHLVAPSRGVAAPAELRDLPAAQPLDEHAAIAKPDTGKRAVVDVAVDPGEPAAVYAAVLEHPPSDAGTATVARVELAARQWTWQRSDGCGAGTPLALALAAEVVVCAARGEHLGEGTVRATSRAGAPRWDYDIDTIDGIAAAGDTVLVFDADRAVVLDAATGRVRGHLASDDGGPVRAAVVPLGEVTLVIVYEGGRVVARWPRHGMLPVWSLAVDGVVRALAPFDNGVLVALEDGDAYRVDARTAAHASIAGLGLGWRARGDVLLGEVAGGDVPGPYPPAPPPSAARRAPAAARRAPAATPAELEGPRLWRPIAPPPSLGPAWQLAIYEPSGGLRARNDYALAGAATATARGPAGSPLVVRYTGGALALDPRSGDPLRRVELPEGAQVFSTVVDGSPVTGAVMPDPLRVVPF